MKLVSLLIWQRSSVRKILFMSGLWVCKGWVMSRIN
ncbi:hypothetical protein BMETH_2998_0 [methanotrophic bacterial endosymbiont of Bathymodiolus sp.]|nr:hypothetical protein BMETH_2998_0 [methanotrophic bacterial endosymbiont of Bathymodiolus sp.]